MTLVDLQKKLMNGYLRLTLKIIDFAVLGSCKRRCKLHDGVEVDVRGVIH